MLVVFMLAMAGSQTADVRTVSLSLGADIPGPGKDQHYRYVSVEDTYLDREQPEKNAGGEFVLLGDRSKTILIRFGDLERALGKYRHIRKASLILSPDSPSKATLASIGQVLTPWGEGPQLVTGAGKAMIPTRAATWKDRRNGPEAIAWGLGGARSESDVRAIPDAKAVETNGDLSIAGLEKSVQYMADHPLENNGFALQFTGPCEMVSSQAPSRHPRLVLEVEAVAPATGPDLSVTRIDRTPTYDVAGAEKNAPAKGEEVTYTAHVKNVGSAPSTGFLARWSSNERPGSALEVDKPLKPGEETTVSTKLSYVPALGDHRGATLAFLMSPKGPDADPRNDALEVNAQGRIVGLAVSKSFADQVEATSGYRSIEDWAQAQMRLLNQTYLPHSRFSFAPDGVMERFRLQSIQVVPDEAMKDQRGGEDLDAFVKLDSSDEVSGTAFINKLGLAVGLSDLAAMNRGYQPSASAPMRMSSDRFGGVMGGGDTRYDGGVSAFFVLPSEPYSNPVFDFVVLEPSGLFSATDVAALNAAVDTRGKVKSPLSDPPTTVIIKAVGLAGKPLEGAELTFFQTKNGKIDDASPAFTVVTDASGTASLPNRPAATKANPFGEIDPQGQNGLFLIRVTANGVTDYGWLKAWQLVDAFHRTHQPASIFELRFNLPTEPLDEATNLAEGKPLKDSAGSLPAKLAGLVDGSFDTEVQLPAGRDAWVEIDLGRDRPVAEIRLILNSPNFWQKFEIQGYATGQEASSAQVWMKELDWNWTAKARAEGNGKVLQIPYRGSAARFRYIRIVNKSGSDQPVSLAEIKVVPVRS